MFEAYISTLAALGGTVVGGLTSFASSWLTQTSQSRAQRIAAERARRDDLYGRFVDEMAELYSHALSEREVDFARLVPILALRGRVILQASQPVADSADRGVRYLLDLYIGPKLSAEEVRAMWERERLDPIKEFATLCREELKRLR